MCAVGNTLDEMVSTPYCVRSKALGAGDMRDLGNEANGWGWELKRLHAKLKKRVKAIAIMRKAEADFRLLRADFPMQTDTDRLAWILNELESGGFYLSQWRMELA